MLSMTRFTFTNFMRAVACFLFTLIGVVSSDIAHATSTPALPAQAVVQAPASISELARALKNDADLIYQYVYNNVEFSPTFGQMKGPLGTLLDGRGNSFDQASLMIALLREAGYTANYIHGIIRITASEAASWLDVTNTTGCVAVNVLSNGGIPLHWNTSSGNDTCSGTLNYIDLEHVWVKVTISGTVYYFDPSFKTYSYTTGINLASAMSYSQSTLISNAESGMSSGSSPTYIKNIHRTNLRSDLTTYTSNLISYINNTSNNLPAATLEQVIGGRKISPTYTALRQTSLSHQQGSVLHEWTSDIDTSYKTQVTLAMTGWSTQSYTADALYGRRLTVVYSGTQPVLYLDGTSQTTGSSGANVLTVSITHPTISTYNITINMAATSGYTYFVVNAYDFTGRGMIETHRRALMLNKLNGSSDTSEAVLGEALAVTAYTYLAQYGRMLLMSNQINGTTTYMFHTAGVVAQTTSAYVDLPGFRTGDAWRGVCAGGGSACELAMLRASFYSRNSNASALECGAVEQTTTVGAVCTAKLFDVANSQSDKFFDATSGFDATTTTGPLLNYGTGDRTQINSLLGSRLSVDPTGTRQPVAG